MWIKSFRVTNYKSFDDSGEHNLAPHMNVIVGQNNVGKTALLQAIAQRIECRPHRNSRQRRAEPLNPASKIELDFLATGQEIRDAMLIRGGHIQVPLPESWRGDANRFWQLPEVTFSAAYRDPQGQGTGWIQSRFPSNNLAMNGQGLSVTFSANEERTGFTIGEIVQAQPRFDQIGTLAGRALQQRTYLFDALRVPAPHSQAGSNSQLLPNAQNLPEVLSTFQPNRTLYKSYVDQVRRVLPLVKWVDVTPKGNNTEIRVWNIEEASTRDDLPNSLSECGTGVGQVLAILYVVMRSKGDVICIDEPNSFLHPGAAKALMAVLNEHQEHQYIIATHSPEIIVASQPERLFMLNFKDEQSVINELDQSDVDSARRMLDEIGSRFSDVFGTDAVIWVEGPTEEECFPLLVKAAEIQMPAGMVIARLRGTGDLEGKRAKACADIYRNLSAAGSILPHNVTITLDGDKTKNPYVATLEEVFETKVRFLPRQMYECYLLHPPAVAALLNSLPSFKNAPISQSRVEEWISAKGQDAKYRAQSHKILSDEWLSAVDAARLLVDLVQSLSDAKENYSKTSHSVWLTRWLIANDKDFLQELIDYVSGLVKVAGLPSEASPQ